MCASCVVDSLQILPDVGCDRVAEIALRRRLTRQIPANLGKNLAACRWLSVALQ